MFCDWSNEHKRWYSNSLEEKFDQVTGRIVAAPIHTSKFLKSSRTNTQRTEKSRQSIFERNQSPIVDQGPAKPNVVHQQSSPRTYTNPDKGYVQPLPPSEDEDDDEGDESGEQRRTDTNNHSDDENRDFSFGTTRKVHAIATKASEAVLVLKHNIFELSQLRDYYETITKRRNFPPEIAQNCRDSVDDFQLHVEGVEKDMQVQILRPEWLLSPIDDPKNLVGPSTPKSILLRHTVRVRVDNRQKTQYGWVNFADTNDAQLKSILDYQNTKANKSSTHSMVIMTEDMNDIARKTKIETVSKKVITLVTLFFLP
ncbi:MAG: hypothetical protein Q9193_004703 [Seirophora villosa]